MFTGYKPNDFAAKSVVAFVVVVVVVVIIFDGFVSITQCSLESFLYTFAFVGCQRQQQQEQQ